MTNSQAHQDICRQFADLLSYPTETVRETTIACQGLLRPLRPEAAAQLQSFAEFLLTTEGARIEEIFTSTFDLQPICHPYVGYQLCGESQQRGMFLMKLNVIYREHGYDPGRELPDHFSELLRFIGSSDDRNCCQILIDDGLLPAVEKIISGIENDDHPYKWLLKSLRSFLTESGGVSVKGDLS
jgi:nitrate reductase molybdenum cofactor assembly chaperone NarJ/NarW